jgi:hypothetical protein
VLAAKAKTGFLAGMELDGSRNEMRNVSFHLPRAGKAWGFTHQQRG